MAVIRIFLAILFFLVALTGRAFAFDIIIFPDSNTVSTKPDKTVSESVTIENLESTSTTVYPVVLSDNEGDKHVLLYNTWVAVPSVITIPADSEYTLNYAITVPANTYGGEYYYTLGFSDSPYTDDESDNPPLVAGHRLTIQVDGPSKPSTSSSTSTSTSTPSPTPSSITRTSVEPTPTPLPNLYSNLELGNFSAFYNPLDQSERLSIKIKNNGNISSTPNGYILFEKGQKEIERIDFNPGAKALMPWEERDFKVIFKPQEDLMGFFSANLYLGYSNSQKESSPRFLKTENFFYVSTRPLAVAFGTFLALFLLEKFFNSVKIKPKRSFALRYSGHFFALSILVVSVIYLQWFTKIDKNTLGDTVTVAVSGTVKKNIIGFKKTTINGEKALILRCNTKKGLKAISDKKLLLEGDQLSSGGKILKIGKYRRPILMIHNGF